jgi:hypothetical protein
MLSPVPCLVPAMPTFYASGSLQTFRRPGPGKSIISERTRIMNKTDILADEEAMEIALCFFAKLIEQAVQEAELARAEIPGWLRG